MVVKITFRHEPCEILMADGEKCGREFVPSGNDASQNFCPLHRQKRSPEVEQEAVEELKAILAGTSLKARLPFDFSGFALPQFALDAVNFTSHVFFTHAHFQHPFWFSKTKFTHGVTFEKAIFGHDTIFETVTFSGQTSFQETSFNQKVVFQGCRFDDCNFNVAHFAALGGFDHCDFAGPAIFTSARWGGPARFMDSKFAGRLRLSFIYLRTPSTCFDAPAEKDALSWKASSRQPSA